MLKNSWYTLNIILATISLTFAIVLEVFDVTYMSCWFVVAFAFFTFFIVVPPSIKRIGRKNKVLHNLLIVLSAIVMSALLAFVILAFVYYGLTDNKFFSFFEIVFYPCIIVYALLELSIDNFKESYFLRATNDIYTDN